MALLPRMGQGALQDESNVRNTLRANVAEKLADVWLAAHLCQKQAVEFCRCEQNKGSCFYKMGLSLSQVWISCYHGIDQPWELSSPQCQHCQIAR